MKQSLQYFLVFILLGACTNVVAQDIFKADKGEVTFFSSAPLEDIIATSKQLNSFLNVATGEIAFIIPMRSFNFKKSLMQEHFNEKYVESDKFPNALFKGFIREKLIDSNSTKQMVTVSGKLTIHGVEKDIAESGEIEFRTDSVLLNSKFNIAVDEFNISIPKLLFNNIADTVEVSLKALYLPYKK